MSENNYGALMMKSALSAGIDIDTLLLPGIYPVQSGNASAPSLNGGILVVHSGTVKLRTFISDSIVCATSSYNSSLSSWSPWSIALSHDEAGSTDDDMGTSLLTHVQPGIFSGSLREYLNSSIKFVTPELFGYSSSGTKQENAAAIMQALKISSDNNLTCKFQNGTYSSEALEVDFTVNIEISPSSYLDFPLVIRGKHFDALRSVKTALPWSSLPAGTTSISGDFTLFTNGNPVAIMLNDIDGGSAAEGNETGVDFSLISSKSSTSLTLSTATRLPYQNPEILELKSAFKYSGTLLADDFFIAGDYTSSFIAGDIIRIENTSGHYSVEAGLFYFELAKIHLVTSSGIVLKSRLNYSHINPWIVRANFIESVKISGGGRVKRLEIRQCDTPSLTDLSVDRLITGFSYDVSVSNINSVGVGEPSTANFSYCFGRSIASNIRVGGSSSVTDNAALKFMSCPKMQFNGITCDNTTSTGTQGDYGVFGDAYYTPYYCWNKGVSVSGVTVEKPRSPVNRAVWFYGLLDSTVSNVKGGQVFLQGCVHSSFTEIVTPNELLETQDLIECNVGGICRNIRQLGGIGNIVSVTTTGLGESTDINTASRFGSGVKNPLTGEGYLIGKRNKININSLSDSTSAITIYAQSQDRLVIGSDCADKDTVASSIVFGSDITNPKMQPNLLNGVMASGSGWKGTRIKGGIHFDGDFRDGYWRSNEKYLWVTGDGKLKLNLTQPDSDSPSGASTIGP